MEDTAIDPGGKGFWSFYRREYRDEHQHPINIALHLLGTVAGLGLLVASLTIWPVWTALLFPLVHAMPGLIGHRLFERNTEVGDARVLRKDFPALWFMAANHVMALQLLLRPLGYRR